MKRNIPQRWKEFRTKRLPVMRTRWLSALPIILVSLILLLGMWGVFGVRYQIYALPCGGDERDDVLRRDLETLYRAMVPEPYYRGNVIFYGG